MTNTATPNPANLPSTAADRLLSRDLPPEWLAENTKAYATPTTRTHRGVRSALVFQMGEELFAFDPKVVQEAAENCVFHSLPKQKQWSVLGLVNVRGELIICASLSGILRLNASQEPEQRNRTRVFRKILVIGQKGLKLALPVDQVCGIHRFDPLDLSPAPEALSKTAVTYTEGLLEWGGRLVALIDHSLVLSTFRNGMK